MHEQTMQFLNNEEFSELTARMHLVSNGIEWKPIDNIPMGIGLVVMAFQRLESSILNFAAAKLLGLRGVNDSNFQALTHKLSFGNVLVITKILAANKKYDRIDELTVGLKMAGKAEERRNSIVHSNWFGDGLRVKVVGKKSGEIGWTNEKLLPGDLLDIAKRIDEIDRLISTLHFSGPGGYDVVGERDKPT